jgi:mannosyltransferase OCH1-like enzyme
MENRLTKKSFIQISAIQQINEATIVLRHFIELSAKLLPFFNELSKKSVLLPQEQHDRNKIIEVYKNYRFDTSTSEILMESDILEIIQQTFKSIEKRKPGKDSDSDKLMTIFHNKHHQLVHNWKQTDIN